VAERFNAQAWKTFFFEKRKFYQRKKPEASLQVINY